MNLILDIIGWDLVDKILTRSPISPYKNQTKFSYMSVPFRAGGGELQRVLDMEESLEETVVRRYMISILNALRFLHHHNIAHLDLKVLSLNYPYGEFSVR